MAPEALSLVAKHCNDRKLAAKAAQEASSKIFLCALLKDKPAVTHGLVHALGPRYLCCLLPEYGFEVRVSIENLQGGALGAVHSSSAGTVQLARRGAGAEGAPPQDDPRRQAGRASTSAHAASSSARS